jgi:hypothetical protein
MSRRALYQVSDSQTAGGNGTGTPPLGVGALSYQTYYTAGTLIPLGMVPKSMALCVKGTGGAAAAWSALLEGSLDGANWTSILTHIQGANADGATVWTGAGLYYPVNYLRTRLVSVTLTGATALVISALGV